MLGIIYIVAQLAGGSICAFVAAFLLEDQSADDSFSCIVEPIKDDELSTKYWTAMWSELLGTFFYVTFFLMSSDKRTRFSNDKVINSFILAGAFVASRLISGGRMVTGLPQGTFKKSVSKGDPDEFEDLEFTIYRYSGPLLNSALALGQQVISLDFTYILQYVAMPMIASAAALFFHEFVFMKTQEILALSEIDDNSNMESISNVDINSNLDQD